MLGIVNKNYFHNYHNILPYTCMNQPRIHLIIKNDYSHNCIQCNYNY